MEETNKNKRIMQYSYLIFGISIIILDVILGALILINYIYYFSGKLFITLDPMKTPLLNYSFLLLSFYTIIAILSIITYNGIKKEKTYARYTGIISVLLFALSIFIDISDINNTIIKITGILIAIPSIFIFIYNIIYWNEIKGFNKITMPNLKTILIITCALIIFIGGFLYFNYANNFNKDKIIGTWEPINQVSSTNSLSTLNYTTTLTFYENNTYKKTFTNNSNEDFIDYWDYYIVSNGKILWSYDGIHYDLADYVTFEDDGNTLYFHNSKNRIFPYIKKNEESLP